MSSYIADNETINKIVSYFYVKALGGDISVISTGLVKLGFDLSNADLAELLANQMFDLNVAAIKVRYGKEAEKFRPLDFKYLFTPATQIEVIKALECWLYQCTERDIPLSEFYKALAQTHCLLCSDYSHQLDEYEVAPWG